MFQPVESDNESHHSVFLDSSESGDSADFAELCINCGSLDNCSCEQNNPTDFFIVAQDAAGAAVDPAIVQWVNDGPNNMAHPDNAAF